MINVSGDDSPMKAYFTMAIEDFERRARARNAPALAEEAEFAVVSVLDFLFIQLATGDELAAAMLAHLTKAALQFQANQKRRRARPRRH